MIPFFFFDVAIPEGEINLGKHLIILDFGLDEGASDLEEEVESMEFRQDIFDVKDAVKKTRKKLFQLSPDVITIW